jgi:cellulose synthase/poly-beta-1,6-N-acetylglucosamine synthase-like glycosyltransferase
MIRNEITKYYSLGFKINQIKRANRAGFKAGALQNALTYTNGKYIAIFDADNIPPQNFLKRTVPILESNPKLGFIQTCLEYNNRNISPLTKAFALALDNHYKLEQPARQNLSLISTFNGSAGIIRKTALFEIGGWRSYTLTEDVDLSARMAIYGWNYRYLDNVIVGSDVPYTLIDFINQQTRWATGGIQATRRLIKPIWLSRSLTLFQKIEASVHLTNYLIFPVMVVSYLLSIALVVLGFDFKPFFYSIFGFIPILGSIGVLLMYLSSIILTGGVIGKIPYFILLMMVGIGISPRLLLKVLKNIIFNKNEFVTTPKYDSTSTFNHNDEKICKNYTNYLNIEIIFIFITIVGIVYSFINKLDLIIFSLIFQFFSYLVALYYQ